MASSVEGVFKPGYIAPNSLIWDPDVRQQIFPTYREDTLFDFLFHSNRRKRTKQTKYYHYEHDYLFSVWNVESVVGTPTNAAGQPVTVILKDADHQESGKQSWPLKNDTIMIGEIRGRVAAVDRATDNAHQVTLHPLPDTANIVAVAIADAEVVTYGDAHADGGGQPDSRVRKPNEFYNAVQNLKTKFKAFGSESANQTRTKHNGKEYFYLQGVMDAHLLHQMKIQFTLIFGEYSDTETSDDADNAGTTIYTTRGLDKYVEDFGNLESYTTSFQKTDLRSMSRTLDNERAASDLLLLAAVELNMDIDDMVGSELKNTDINHAKLGVGSERARKVDFGFDAVRYGNRTFNKMKFDAMNYGAVTGRAGAPWPTNGYVIPMARIRNADPNAGENDAMVDTICLRYKSNDRENRFEKHWTRDQKITNLDQIEFNHHSELGLMMAGLNQAIKIEKS